MRAGRWGQCVVLADVAGAFASKFRELLERVAWLRRNQVRTGTNARDHGRALQTLLSLPSGDKVELCVECRRELRPGEFRRWVEQRQVTDIALDAAKLNDGHYAELVQLLLDTKRYRRGDKDFQLVVERAVTVPEVTPAGRAAKTRQQAGS